MLDGDSQNSNQRGNRKCRKDQVKRSWRLRWPSRWKKSLVEDASHHSQSSNLSHSDIHQVSKIPYISAATNACNSLDAPERRRAPHIAPLIFQFQRTSTTASVIIPSVSHHTAQKQSDAAMRNRLEALQIQAQLMGDDHPDTIFAKNNMAKSCNQDQRPTLAKNRAAKDSSSSSRSENSRSAEGSNDESFPIRKIFLPSNSSTGYLDLDSSKSSSSYLGTVTGCCTETIQTQKQMMGDDNPDTIFATNKMTVGSGKRDKDKGGVRRNIGA